MTLKGLLIFYMLTLSACAGASLMLAPGDHYHCNEALVENLGKLDEAVREAKVSCEAAGYLLPSNGDIKDDK